MIGAMQDVTYTQEEQKRIAKAIIDAQELERRYIGQELHDNVNQILAASRLTLSVAKNIGPTNDRVKALIETSTGYIYEAIEELRKLSHRLAPATFDDMSLKEKFEDLLLSINPDNRYQITLQFDEIKEEYSSDIWINLYRILQEQIKNIISYSEADSIEISVMSSGNVIVMRIFDNGKGFDTKTSKNGIGLSNIRNRIDSFCGKFILNSAPGKGCEMIVEIPQRIPGD
jgi:signal transduction histidine kinase